MLLKAAKYISNSTYQYFGSNAFYFNTTYFRRSFYFLGNNNLYLTFSEIKHNWIKKKLSFKYIAFIIILKVIYISGIILYQPTQIAPSKKMKLNLLLAFASFFLHESGGYPSPVERTIGVGEFSRDWADASKYHWQSCWKGGK